MLRLGTLVAAVSRIARATHDDAPNELADWRRRNAGVELLEEVHVRVVAPRVVEAHRLVDVRRPRQAEHFVTTDAQPWDAVDRCEARSTTLALFETYA